MTLDDLVALECIKRLKYRYMRALDTHDWPLMRSVFAEDAFAWYGGGKYTSSGADEIVAMLSGIIDASFVSSHVALHPEIDLLGPTRATGHWRIEDTVHFLKANPGSGPDIRAGDELQGAGYYTDEYAKLDGEWKIASTGYVRIYERIESRGQRDVVVHVEPALGALDRLPPDARPEFPED